MLRIVRCEFVLLERLFAESADSDTETAVAAWAKDFENLTRTQLAFLQLAMIRLMPCGIARGCQTS